MPDPKHPIHTYMFIEITLTYSICTFKKEMQNAHFLFSVNAFADATNQITVRSGL